MAIDKKIINFKKGEDFTREYNAGNILDKSLVFIDDTHEIVTHKTVFDGNIPDWNANEGQPGFIKNKPDLSNLGGSSLPPYPKSNQVYYTTTDNKILNDLGSDLKPVIKSNEYFENEMVGVITFNEDITQLVSFNNIAYADKSRIKSITLPETITSFSESQFNYMLSFESVNIPDNITELPNYFLYGSKVRNIKMPSKLEKIGNYAFYNCQLLESISFGNCEYLSEIGRSAFQECKSLVYVANFNRTMVYTINDYTFYRCTSLININLSNVYTIGNYAFDDCKSLTNLNLSLVNNLSDCAFYNCTSIHTVFINQYNTNIKLDSFKTNNNGTNQINFYVYGCDGDYNDSYNDNIVKYQNAYPDFKNQFHTWKGKDIYVYQNQLWTGTQDEYDGITSKDSNTFYFIKEEA
ncbi:MAG: leucine-rich repeat protein [Muribaculaceae bacterium]|nr:leucine-rich repeat protein [Muribaculaceae bacterium]